MSEQIHSCSYYCTRFQCAVRQRDDLRELLIELSMRLASFGGKPIEPLPLKERDE